MSAFDSLMFRDVTKPGAGIVPRAEWDIGPWNRWSFQHVREIVPTVAVRRGSAPVCEFPVALRDFGSISFNCDGRLLTIDDFLGETFTDGFLVLHRGRIVAETYENGMRPETLHLSQSVAKSVVGAVAGILVGRGQLDPKAHVTDYLPELAVTAYEGATIQHVMDMTSGVLFDEDYTSPDSHIAKVDIASGWKERTGASSPDCVWDLILTLDQLECAHGESFRYRSIETDVLAFVLQRITGLPLAELVSKELWEKLGAEEDACFTIDPAGYALADGGFNATLRDYGRFAMMISHGGRFNGQQIVPAQWVEETIKGNRTVFGADYRIVLPNGTYHNQFWVEDLDKRVLLSRGVFGQLLYMDPDADFVAVKLSSWPDFTNPRRTRLTLAAIHAIRAALVE
jgi:CubicO group peptidase (beta-lactamase class C family)